LIAGASRTGAAGDGLSTVAIAAYHGADLSQPRQSKLVNMNDPHILQFAGNQVSGATQSGMTLWWIGTFGATPHADFQVSVVIHFVAWNFSIRGFFGNPTNNVTIDCMVVRSDVSELSNQCNHVTGINFDDYMTHNLLIQNADIQGTATDIEAPFYGGTLFGDRHDRDPDQLPREHCQHRPGSRRSVDGSSGLEPRPLDIISGQFAHPSTAPTS
jgi:hypothetical protein